MLLKSDIYYSHDIAVWHDMIYALILPIAIYAAETWVSAKENTRVLAVSLWK